MQIYTVNSTELRRVVVELVPERPAILELDVVRGAVCRQTRVTNNAKSTITRHVKKTSAAKKGQKWVIPSGDENVILGNCCS